MSENRRKAAFWAIAALLVLAVAAGLYYSSKHRPEPVEEMQAQDGASVENEDGSSSSTLGNTSSQPAASKPAAKPGVKLVSDVTASSLTYTQAVAIFENTLIAFNEDCKMIPNPVFVKSGTTMMFDNRSRNARTFKLDGTSYTIPGYGFKLFQLRSTRLPHVVQVECGSNSGEITLQ